MESVTTEIDDGTYEQIRGIQFALWVQNAILLVGIGGVFGAIIRLCMVAENLKLF